MSSASRKRGLAPADAIAAPEAIKVPKPSAAVSVSPNAPPGPAKRILLYAVLIAIAILFLLPFAWSVSTSFKPLPETTQFNLIPENPSLTAYRDVITNYDFGRYMANSAGIATAITLSNLLLASLGGYAFARLKFPGRELLFLLVLGSLMIPDQLRLVPVFIMLTNWNLVDTYQGLILINLVQAASLFLMRQFFLTIPKSLEEAARLDGAGYLRTFWSVMLPLATPALAAVTIIVFQGAWNELFWPLLILQDSSRWTLPLGLARFSSEYQTLWPQLMAASVLSILPIAVLYLFFQRYFVAGIASSGVKG